MCIVSVLCDCYDVYVYKYVYIYIHICIYVYVCIERDRDMYICSAIGVHPDLQLRLPAEHHSAESPGRAAAQIHLRTCTPPREYLCGSPDSLDGLFMPVNTSTLFKSRAAQPCSNREGPTRADSYF